VASNPDQPGGIGIDIYLYLGGSDLHRSRGSLQQASGVAPLDKFLATPMAGCWMKQQLIELNCSTDVCVNFLLVFLSQQFPVSQALDHVEMSVKMASASYSLPSSVVVSVPAQHCLAKVYCCKVLISCFRDFQCFESVVQATGVASGPVKYRAAIISKSSCLGTGLTWSNSEQ